MIIYKIISNEKIYREKNDKNRIKTLLKKYIPEKQYEKIKFIKAQISFIKIIGKYEYLEI